MTSADSDRDRESGRVRWQRVFPEPEGVREGMEFVVSHDPHGFSLEEMHLSNNDIRALPPRATVVEAGSGLMFGLAKRMIGLRPDINMICIDPTLGFSPDRADILISHDGDKAYYHIQPPGSVRKEQADYFRWFQKQRRNSVPSGVRVLTALTPKIELPDASVELLIDSYGPGLYLDKGRFVQYVQSIARILKPYAQARIYPIGPWLGTKYGIDRERYRTEALQMMKEILSSIPSLSMPSELYFMSNDGLGIVLVRK